MKLSRTTKWFIVIGVLALIGIIWRWDFVSGEIAQAFAARFPG